MNRIEQPRLWSERSGRREKGHQHLTRLELAHSGWEVRRVGHERKVWYQEQAFVRASGSTLYAGHVGHVDVELGKTVAARIGLVVQLQIELDLKLLAELVDAGHA